MDSKVAQVIHIYIGVMIARTGSLTIIQQQAAVDVEVPYIHTGNYPVLDNITASCNVDDTRLVYQTTPRPDTLTFGPNIVHSSCDQCWIIYNPDGAFFIKRKSKDMSLIKRACKTPDYNSHTCIPIGTTKNVTVQCWRHEDPTASLMSFTVSVHSVSNTSLNIVTATTLLLSCGDGTSKQPTFAESRASGNQLLLAFVCIAAIASTSIVLYKVYRITKRCNHRASQTNNDDTNNLQDPEIANTTGTEHEEANPELPSRPPPLGSDQSQRQTEPKTFYEPEDDQGRLYV